MTDDELIARLEGLPDEVPPPSRLDRAVLAPKGRQRRASRTGIPLTLVAAVCLAIFGFYVWQGSKGDPPKMTLIAGSQLVEGENIELWVGPSRLRIDGLARVDVEPASPVVRSSAQEDPMVVRSLVAAAAGAAITVTVYEGTAYLFPADSAEPLEIHEGSSLRHGGPNLAAQAPVEAAPRPVEVDALDGATADYVGQLEADNRALRFENQLLKGQSEVAGGLPVAWPDELNAGLTADAFEASMRKAGEGVEGLEMLQVDCSEYPCIAAMWVPTGGDMSALQANLSSMSNALSENLGLDDLSMSTSVSMENDASRALTLMAPIGDQGPDPDVRDRLMKRLQDLGEDLSSEHGLHDERDEFEDAVEGPGE